MAAKIVGKVRSHAAKETSFTDHAVAVALQVLNTRTYHLLHFPSHDIRYPYNEDLLAVSYDHRRYLRCSPYLRCGSIIATHYV